MQFSPCLFEYREELLDCFFPLASKAPCLCLPWIFKGRRDEGTFNTEREKLENQRSVTSKNRQTIIEMGQCSFVSLHCKMYCGT